MKKIIFNLGLAVLMFSACSSDSDEAMSTSGMKEYSAEEIQQIQKLQDEYGVSFEFPTKSSKELPSVQDYENLCKFVASLNSNKATIERNGNSISGSIKPPSRGRFYTRATESSGYHWGSGSINLDGNGSYGSFDYDVTWDGKTAEGRVKSIDSPGGWNIYEEGFDFSFERDHFLSFTFYFTASSRYGVSVIHGLKYSKTVIV